MKPSHLLLATALATALPALAAEPPPGAPRPAGAFRIFKPDGSTLLQQGTLGATGPQATLTVDTSNAIAAANGRCAFNVKYDEIAGAAASQTTNRLYANDQLVAQNTQIDLAAGVVKTIWTQPYLFAGVNNVKVVINAESATPIAGWIRVNVTGGCGAKPSTAPVYVKVGTSDWGQLLVAWGYSNYAVNGLKGKGYARYADLVKLNADLTAAIAARQVEIGAFNALIARWNAFVNDPDFRRLMKDVKPGDPK
jgi:hypothetical protein